TVSQFRRDVQGTYEWAERVVALCTEQGFGLWVPSTTVLRGWALAQQGQYAEGIAQMRQGTAAWRATGAAVDQPYFLACWPKHMGKPAKLTPRWPCLKRRWSWPTTMKIYIGPQKCIASRAICSCIRDSLRGETPKPVGIRPSPSPATSRPGRWNYRQR